MTRRAKIEVEITEKHINFGIRRDCFNCVLALAICEALGVDWQVQVHPRVVAIRRISNNDVFYYKLPLETRDYIQTFDIAETVLPCKLRIEEYDVQPRRDSPSLPLLQPWPPTGRPGPDRYQEVTP